MAAIRILHLEDLLYDADLVQHELKKGKLEFEYCWAENKADFERQLATFKPDIVISDYSLPSFTCEDALQLVTDMKNPVPVIMVTATISEEFAVLMMKKGLADYLLKDRLERLPGAVLNALDTWRAKEEQRKFFNRLIENESMLRQTEKLAHIGGWTANLQNGDIYWSDEAFAIYGYRPNEVSPSFELVLQHIHPEDLAETKAILDNTVQNLDTSKTTFRIIDKQGHVKYIHSELIVERDTDGRPVMLRGFNQDVTERKLAEDTIKKSEANLAAVINNTDALIYSLDRELRYITFNTLLKSTLKYIYNIDLQVGDYVYKFLKKLQPEDAADWQQHYANALSGKSVQFIKEYIVDGMVTFTSFSINPIWQQNTVIGLSCFARDITAQKTAEAKIIAFNESLEAKVKERTIELEEANRDLEAFNYTVSHDLQSPLRSLSGFSKILLKEHSSKLNEEGLEFLRIIDSSANRMSDLIKELLAFSKLGKAGLSKKKVDMNELVSVVKDEIAFCAKDFRANIQVHPLIDLECDPMLTRQVWLNLIHNAVKYSGKKEKPEITIGMETINNEPVFYVRDNGAGFDMKYADRLFGVFQRMHMPSEFEGTGVGLATVHRIVTKHGGKIWAEAEKNVGAVFYFTLSPN